jgi:hypothetical protein
VASSTPDPDIQFWFKQLGQFQAACINNSAGKLTPFQFANATIILALNSANSQKQFLTAVANSTGYDDLQISDLTTYKTFGALLNYCNAFSSGLFNALQPLAVAALQHVDSKPFLAATVATAFPGGSTGPGWVQAMGVLMASMDPTCFTLAFRIGVNATVDKAGATMGDLMTQIAGLG